MNINLNLISWKLWCINFSMTVNRRLIFCTPESRDIVIPCNSLEFHVHNSQDFRVIPKVLCTYFNQCFTRVYFSLNKKFRRYRHLNFTRAAWCGGREFYIFGTFGISFFQFSNSFLEGGEYYKKNYLKTVHFSAYPISKNLI